MICAMTSLTIIILTNLLRYLDPQDSWGKWRMRKQCIPGRLSQLRAAWNRGYILTWPPQVIIIKSIYYRIAGNFRIEEHHTKIKTYENFIAQYCHNHNLCSTSLRWAVRYTKIGTSYEKLHQQKLPAIQYLWNQKSMTLLYISNNAPPPPLPGIGRD